MTTAEVKERLLEELKEGPKKTMELVSITGIKKDPVYDCLKRCELEGLVKGVVYGSEKMWYDKSQWDHIEEKMKDLGPIRRYEINRVKLYICRGFRIRVYEYNPKKGEEKEGRIVRKTVSAMYSNIVTFKEGGSATYTQLAEYFREKSGERCVR